MHNVELETLEQILKWKYGSSWTSFRYKTGNFTNTQCSLVYDKKNFGHSSSMLNSMRYHFCLGLKLSSSFYNLDAVLYFSTLADSLFSFQFSIIGMFHCLKSSIPTFMPSHTYENMHTILVLRNIVNYHWSLPVYGY